MKQVLIIVLAVIVLSASCVTHTNVTFDSDPQGAEVYVDNRLIGETPVSTRLSNAIWEDYRVRVIEEGYRDALGSAEKEVKAANLIFGLLLWWPSLLWVYGPDDHQYYDLIEE